jgi:hypothetical protein
MNRRITERIEFVLDKIYSGNYNVSDLGTILIGLGIIFLANTFATMLDTYISNKHDKRI